jgi:hypothetical protein
MTKPNVYLVGGEIDRREQEYNETILRNLVRLIETGNNVKEKYNQDMEPFGVEAISTDGTMKIFIYRAKNDPLADITFYQKDNGIDFKKSVSENFMKTMYENNLYAGPLSETYMLNSDASITRSVYREITDNELNIIPELSILLDREEMIEDDERDEFISKLQNITSL